MRRSVLNKYRLAIFDFDGTLADSFPFFAESFGSLADRHGFRRVTPDEASSLRRLDAREIMARLGLPAWKLPIVARSFVALMRENASRVPLFEGIPETLAALHAAGVSIAIVSSNSRDNVERVLGGENARLVSGFECGASIFGKRSRLSRVLRRAGVQCADAIYIGDQSTDHDAARAAGITFGAVAWGYGDYDALRERRPDVLFERVSDIAVLLSALR